MRRLASLLVIGAAATLVLPAQDRAGPRVPLGGDLPERPRVTAGSCTDADGDGFCDVDDCDDADPNCNVDCTDADGDGFCPPHDCDDGLPHSSDPDGDGVPDACDNCPATPNHQQQDFEGFGPQELVSAAADGVRSILAADMDGDPLGC